MAIGHQPIRERLILPRRQGVPLVHVFEGESSFPASSEAYLYLYDGNDEELAFWPLTIDGADVTLDVDSEEWWPYRATARSFTVFVVYPSDLSKKWSWYEGSVLRLS